MAIKLSALDVVPIYEGESAKEAFDRSARLAKHLEDEDFERFLVAEHHNLGGTASSSTSNVIQYILGNTDKIRVGAGGVMLPNHSPLQVAETYGTLDAIYPNRVDLGIGRAPGTDQNTSAFITRKPYFDVNEFAHDIQLIEHFFKPLEEQGIVGAFPGAGANVPIIILGSSLNSAYVAAALGLPYSFAGHINPNDVGEAIEIYRNNFKPSEYLNEPYVILGTWLFTADTDEKAEKLYESNQRKFLKAIRGEKGRIKKQSEMEDEIPLTSAEKIILTKNMGMNVRGSKETIKPQLEEIIAKYNPDEIIAVTSMSEDEDLHRNYDILKEAITEIEEDN